MLSFTLQAFSLSFRIFWRAVPAWGVMAALVYTIYSFFGQSAIVTGLLLMLFSGPIFVFLGLIHVRSGLTSLGEITAPAPSKFIRRTFRFYFFSVLVMLVYFALVIAGYALLQEFGLLGQETGAPKGSLTEMSTVKSLLLPDRTAGIYNLTDAYFTVANLLSVLVNAALAVPLAANAAACGEKAPDHEVFYGFGAHSVRMFLFQMLTSTLIGVLFIAIVIAAFSVPVFGALIETGFEADAMADVLEEEDLTQSIYIMLGLFSAGIVWWISLWCAGATLCYVEHRDSRVDDLGAAPVRVDDAPMSLDDLRAMRLRRSTGTAPA